MKNIILLLSFLFITLSTYSQKKVETIVNAEIKITKISKKKSTKFNNFAQLKAKELYKVRKRKNTNLI